MKIICCIHLAVEGLAEKRDSTASQILRSVASAFFFSQRTIFPLKLQVANLTPKSIVFYYNATGLHNYPSSMGLQMCLDLLLPNMSTYITN